MACAGVGLSHDERGSGYPVGSVSLPRSGSGGRGVGWSTLRLNELDPCPPIRYALGADAMGYPRF